MNRGLDMKLKDDVTVLVLTYNEDPNIRRTLEAVSWAPRIIVVDSGSTDTTLEIVRTFPQARILTRAFDSFAAQCNFGIAHIQTTWVLSLDADYELSAELQREIQSLAQAEPLAGYTAEFVYRIHGTPLRASLYPARTVLFRRTRAAYQNEGHGHRVKVDGAVGCMAGRIYHDDRKPMARWFTSQLRYAHVEADHLLALPVSERGRNDRIRLLAWPAPLLVFIYTLIVKGCVLDGWAGWSYVLQRVLAEAMLALELTDRRLRGKASGGESSEGKH